MNNDPNTYKYRESAPACTNGTYVLALQHKCINVYTEP